MFSRALIEFMFCGVNFCPAGTDRDAMMTRSVIAAKDSPGWPGPNGFGAF